MDDDIRAELIAEIESFRAELKLRAEAHARRLNAVGALDLPAPELARLDLPEARTLIAKRYAEVKYEHRLAEVERRLAELEARDG
ncbi:hypothetical protein [Enterovirga aerilata]|uniref:Uncharacterized protein n=1 Tax=Enterovirga aerilata TaxID=2730920 RepID=A0A849I8J4_9HYPH|nr:hypothetical protein [Enterovirga sp. DB1703]NNM72390.1 hypothetical protein [Enterovirga sp. DB1703]